MEMFQRDILTKKPSDFDEVWERWLNEVHFVENKVEIVSEVKTSFGKIICFYYDSIASTKIYANLYLQEQSTKPTVVYYHGHNSHIEEDHNIWHCMNLVNAGFSVVAIDMRFQSKRIEDHNEYLFSSYPSACYNISDIENCYHKRLNQDALKIIDILKDPLCFKEVSNLDIIVAGPSQGGGLSLMVAAMSSIPILCSLSDIPSDCALKDRILGKYGKYGAIMGFIEDHPELEETVLNNQDYFDVINMADRIKCPVFASVGTVDDVCPPRFFYQAYKRIKSSKTLEIYEGYGHGGFEEIHLPKKLAFLESVLKEK